MQLRYNPNKEVYVLKVKFPNTLYKKWCKNFMAEQIKSTRIVRQLINKSQIYNPFANYSTIDNILKRYEKSFWG